MSARTGLLCLIAALALSLPGQASAYRIATSGVEVVALPAGPALWDLTIETDTTIGDGGFEVVGATSFTPADPPCDGTNLLCFGQSSAEGVLIGFAVLVPTLTPNVGSPLLVGSLTGDVTSMRDNVGGQFFGFGDLTGARLPVAYLVVPEPSSVLLLGVALGALVGLCRRRIRSVR